MIIMIATLQVPRLYHRAGSSDNTDLTQFQLLLVSSDTPPASSSSQHRLVCNNSTNTMFVSFADTYAVITIAIRPRSDNDVSTQAKKEQSFLAVVVSQSNRMQIVISITSVVVKCVVVSSYRSRTTTVI